MSKILTIYEKKIKFEKPWKIILYFCIPTIFLIIIQQGLYNIIDKSLILKFATPNLINNQFYINAFNQLKNINVKKIPLIDMKKFINIATQYISQIYNLQWSFGILINVGCAINFSIYYGKQDIINIRRIVGNGFLLNIIFSIITSFIIFCITFPGWNSIFITLQIKKQYSLIIKMLCWEYLFPMLFTSIIMFLSCYLITLIRSEGNIKWSIIIILSSLLTNIFTSIFFMKFFNFGILGSILGTIFSWIIQLICCFVFIFKKNSYLKFYLNDLINIKIKNIFNFIKSGLPSFINKISLVITTYITTLIIGKLPNQEYYNGISILQELHSSITPWITLILSSIIGIIQSAYNIIYYNYGTKKKYKIIKFLKYFILLIIIWFCLILIIFIIFGKKMITLFYFPEKLAIKYHWWIVLSFITYPFCSLTYISLILFQIINNSFLAIFISSLRSIIIIIPLIIIGFEISKITGNSIFYYIFIGFNDLISAIIISPILFYYWKKYKNKLINI